VVAALAQILAVCERLFLTAANLLLLGILAINIVNILSRLVFDLGIIWVFPWTRVMFVWMIFLAFFVIYRRGKDISVDVLVKLLPAGVQRAVRVVVALVVVGLMALILSQVPTLLPKQVGHLDLVGIQRYWLAVPFYVACALILLEFVLDLLRALKLAPEREERAA
jgi:TRAP-type C4-dicarboxylate transport system permease small subunit